MRVRRAVRRAAGELGLRMPVVVKVRRRRGLPAHLVRGLVENGDPTDCTGLHVTKAGKYHEVWIVTRGRRREHVAATIAHEVRHAWQAEMSIREFGWRGHLKVWDEESELPYDERPREVDARQYAHAFTRETEAWL